MRGVNFNLTPAGDSLRLTITLVTVLAVEHAIERWFERSRPQPTIDVAECLQVCGGFIDQYSLTHCACKWASE